MPVRQPAPLLVLLAVLAGGVACQSISDSVTSPSRWVADSSQAIADSSGASADSSQASSESSSPGDGETESAIEESSYRGDVRVATAAWIESGRSDDSFKREVGQIAQRHGVSGWENASTYVAVREGLRDAGVGEADADAIIGRLKAPPPVAAPPPAPAGTGGYGMP